METTEAAPSSAPLPVSTLPGNAGLIERLTASMAKIDEFNKDVVVVGDSKTVKLLGVVPTNAATLDAAIGRGGYPFGRITVISGGESSGKTTSALHAIANCQKMGGVGMYCDLENKLDIDYAVKLGVDLKQLVVARPGWAERTFELIGKFIAGVPKGGDIPIVIVLDSINACVTKAEFDAEDYEPNQGGMGGQARMFSQAVKKLVQLLGGRRIAFIAISQPRDKLGQAGSWKEKITGGSTWKFYACLAIDLKKDKDADVKVSGREDGHGLIAECIKNQVAPPFKTAKYNIVWGQGIDYLQSVITQAAKYGFVDIGGAGWGETRDVVQPPHKVECKTKAETGCTCGWVPTMFKWQGVDGKIGFKAKMAARPDMLKFLEQQLTAKLK